MATKQPECPPARTHCPCSFLFLRRTVSSLMFFVFLSRPFLVSGVCFVTVVVSPCRVQRIRLTTLLPLALNTAPRYCLSLALAPFLSLLLFPFSSLTLINTSPSPTHFLVSRSLLTCSSRALLHKLCCLTQAYVRAANLCCEQAGKQSH